MSLSSSLSLGLSFVGHKLGLYRELDRIGPATPVALAQATGTVQTYISFWLINQAAEKYMYICYSPADGAYYMNEAQKKVFLDTEDTSNAVGLLLQNAGLTRSATKRMPEEMRRGAGIPFCDHSPEVFEGLELFSKNVFARSVTDWLPNRLPPHLRARLHC